VLVTISFYGDNDQSMTTQEQASALHPSLLGALQNKYQTLVALRVQDTPEAVPRATFTALSAQFPGSLRELDRLPLPVLQWRLTALAAVAAGTAPIQPWMQLQSGYHGYMRAALRIRRGLLKDPWRVGEPAARCLERMGYVAALDEPGITRVDVGMISVIGKPPGGRLNPWVQRWVARDLGAQPDEVEAALFGTGR
jgi:hypothetical protein